MRRVYAIAFLILTVISFGEVSAQTSSIGARKRQVEASQPKKVTPREAPAKPRNAVYEAYSWITIRPKPPKTFQPGNLITIIVRQSKRYEADAELKTKKELKIKNQLDAFIKLTGGGVGASEFQRGQPNVDFRFSNELKGDADASREDRLTTRLTVTIIDVKPNGTLVLEGKSRLDHDEENSLVTLTGICRKEDVSPDNTVLSTQIANLVLTVENKGALRSATSRGWVSKIMDYLKPF